MKTHSLLKILAVVTVIGAYIMIVLGVLVTTSGSGHGCGNSWPFCHGQIIPGTLTINGVIEYGHRIMSSVDGLLVVITSLWSWLAFRRDTRIKVFAALSFLFILLQGALGALTVVFEGTFALSALLSVHFGLSLIALASVVLLAVRIFQLSSNKPVETPKPGSIAPWLQLSAWGLAVYTYIVVYAGALVEHTGAVIGCGKQFPGCGSNFLPSFTTLAGIQLLHRYMAALLWFCVVGFLVAVLRRYRARRDLVFGAWFSFIMVTLQAISGSLNVFTEGQMLAALVHATLIAIFFSVLCYLCVQIGWPRKQRVMVSQGESKQADLETVSSGNSALS